MTTVEIVKEMKEKKEKLISEINNVRTARDALQKEVRVLDDKLLNLRRSVAALKEEARKTLLEETGIKEGVYLVVPAKTSFVLYKISSIKNGGIDRLIIYSCQQENPFRIDIKRYVPFSGFLEYDVLYLGASLISEEDAKKLIEIAVNADYASDLVLPPFTTTTVKNAEQVVEALDALEEEKQ